MLIVCLLIVVGLIVSVTYRIDRARMRRCLVQWEYDRHYEWATHDRDQLVYEGLQLALIGLRAFRRENFESDWMYAQFVCQQRPVVMGAYAIQLGVSIWQRETYVYGGVVHLVVFVVRHMEHQFAVMMCDHDHHIPRSRVVVGKNARIPDDDREDVAPTCIACIGAEKRWR